MMILDWRNSLEIPPDANISDESIDLIARLICDAKDRVGFEQITKHPWYEGLDWSNLRDLPAPWVPPLKNVTDTVRSLPRLAIPHLPLAHGVVA